ncbi:MAG: aminotransferase class V-fold PLP-dependent enzyme, partial [Myxococcota bacterium]|nr:aminotransferase class V-fold PLP-dependent enzyme [Myxococcota bacterium]
SCHKRAVHKFGAETSRRLDEAREAIRRHLNVPKTGQVVFTRNTTESINLVANAFRFRQGDVVLTSDAEHNSNLLPWQFLQKRGKADHRMFSVPVDAALTDLGELERELATGAVRLVSVFHTSHVTGMTLPIAEITALAHQHGALVLVDAAQGLAHHPIDVHALDVDFLAVSFHKAFGPSGMGALYGKTDHLERLDPFLIGGETVEDVDYQSCELSAVPARFEAGLLNYAGALGSARALEYLGSLGHDQLQAHELALNRLITERLAGLSNVSMVGPPAAEQRGSIVNMRVHGMDAGELSILLDKTKNIMTRAGVHCCHAWYRKHSLPPTLRVSLSAYNTIEEATVFADTMEQMVRHFT